MANVNKPYSLKPGDSVSDRKAYAFTATTSAPTSDSDGFETGNARFVRLSFDYPSGAATQTCWLRVWLWSEISEEWNLVDSIGSSGDVSLEYDDPPPVITIETAGAPRIAINCTSYTASFNVDVWLEGSTF